MGHERWLCNRRDRKAHEKLSLLRSSLEGAGSVYMTYMGRAQSTLQRGGESRRGTVVAAELIRDLDVLFKKEKYKRAHRPRLEGKALQRWMEACCSSWADVAGVITLRSSKIPSCISNFAFSFL